MKIPVVVIFAPTASGKTALAIDLFGKSSHSFFKGEAELISADSMQVYRNFNIGTAKPSLQESLELPHHLIDIYEPNEQYTVSDFVTKADDLCKDIYARGKIPLIAGGTGFYIRSFILGLPKTPESDEKVRLHLKQRLKDEGKDVLYAELQKIDPISAFKINVNDEYRICRALEIFYTTGKTKSSFSMNQKPRDEYDFCTIILNRTREDLYSRINQRVDKMFDLGLKEEVIALINKGIKKEYPAMQAIGYKEWFDFDYNTEEGLEKIKYNIKRNSRKYAKKQYTFMSDIPNANIIECTSSLTNDVEILLKGISKNSTQLIF